MKFRLEIELGDGHDQPLTLIGSTLRDVAQTVQSQGILFAQTRAIADHNGKNVGEWEITEDTPSPADHDQYAKDRIKAGNTRTCEDCGLEEMYCLCGEEPDWHDLAEAIEENTTGKATVEGGGSGPYYIQIALPDGRFILFGASGETWAGQSFANEEGCNAGRELSAFFTSLRSSVTDVNAIAKAFRDAITDVCIAGSPAILGCCGDPDCVCSLT